MTSIEALRSQLSRAWDKHERRARSLGFWSVANHRVGTFTAAHPNPLVRAVGSRVYGLGMLALDLAAGMQLNREARIGDDLHVIHGWNIKVHADAVIGARVGIMHDVTIGTTPDGAGGVPTIGDDVFIGAGARILGRVHIGDGARIGANTLVIADVPAGTTAVGVPARILRYTGRSIEGEPAPTPTPNDDAPLAPMVPFFQKDPFSKDPAPVVPAPVEGAG